ncbi:hemerythrin domain-containing protein [uncultured Clostridium sp.]|jgi:hemerythrin|uniref:bacteriohemerythrin n=1 Tax=uncultured Clostridium sp. TaxID=59620 RepID=UPI00260C6034|nr:hemerythrin domain-containing protein [uncultured Clostridium sp.]
MFEMKESYKIGIDFIDEQHTVIFSIANRAYYLLKDKFVIDKFDKITEIIDELKEYTKSHFAAEEKYMKEIGHKKMFTQKIEHEKFIGMLEDLDLSKVDKNQDEYIEKILRVLGDWLIHHILEKDLLIGK